MSNVIETTPEPVNSNEIISDYHFYIQLFLEEKALDFEEAGKGKTKQIGR